MKTIRTYWQILLIIPISICMCPLIVHYAVIGGIAEIEKIHRGSMQAMMIVMGSAGTLISMLTIAELQLQQKRENFRIWNIIKNSVQ